MTALAVSSFGVSTAVILSFAVYRSSNVVCAVVGSQEPGGCPALRYRPERK
jgi:hypothetical protein